MIEQPNSLITSQKIALGIEYDGLSYFGWQKQKHAKSVQQTLENALSSVANENVTTHCAGRTDTGVHGKGQVVHFETGVHRPLKAWIMGGNSNLPETISISWVKPVADDFHARFSAISRSYRYVIYNKATPSALLCGRVTRVAGALNEVSMQKACQYFLGEQDFTSIRAAHCQSNTPWRNIMDLSVTRYGDFVVVDVTANAFLYHMVRNIVGVLVAVGQGIHAPEWVDSLLAEKDRTKAPATAKATGLYLMGVGYPLRFQIPVHDSSTWFW